MADDFTSKVMAGVKKRPRKIGLWNIAYFVPIFIAVALLSVPVTQQLILNATNKDRVAITNVQKDIDDMYVIMTELEDFSLDQDTQAVLDGAQVESSSDVE